MKQAIGEPMQAFRAIAEARGSVRRAFSRFVEAVDAPSEGFQPVALAFDVMARASLSSPKAY